MNTPRILLTLLSVALCIGYPLSRAEAQVPQEQIARDLRSEDRTIQIRAVERAYHLDSEEVGSELKASLIRALERENRAYHAHLTASRRDRAAAWDHSNIEVHIALIESLVRLRDPATIPVLVRALGGGVRVPRALADFGELAAPAVLELVSDRESPDGLVSSGLVTLRFMVEDPAVTRCPAKRSKRSEGPRSSGSQIPYCRESSRSWCWAGQSISPSLWTTPSFDGWCAPLPRIGTR